MENDTTLTVENIEYLLIILFLHIYFSYRVAKYGVSKGRTFSLNFIASLIFNPILIFISLKVSKFKKVHDYLDEIKQDVKKWTILAILFLLPVFFIFMLFPATHNYNSLDVVNKDVREVADFISIDENKRSFEGNITILSFLGYNPMGNLTVPLNLKELIYDKFKGFKKFQILAISPIGSEDEIKKLMKELYTYDELKYWGFSFGTEAQIDQLYNSLDSNKKLDEDFATTNIFIVDKDLSQRGRLDDRKATEIEKNKSIYRLNSYDVTKVSELKNKMNDDLRILFTEYRQKRKGNYDSNNRRNENIEN